MDSILTKRTFVWYNIVGTDNLGIAFFITNYFCGNKSVFATLNSHQCTSSTISVVCLAKTEPQTAISYPQKCEAPKRAYFLMIFLRAWGRRTKRTPIERSQKSAKKPPFRQLVIRDAIPKFTVIYIEINIF